MKKALIIFAMSLTALCVAACNVKPDVSVLKTYALSAENAVKLTAETEVYRGKLLLGSTAAEYVLCGDTVAVTEVATALSDSLAEAEEYQMTVSDYVLTRGQAAELLPLNVADKLDTVYFENGKYAFRNGTATYNVAQSAADAYLGTDAAAYDISVTVVFKNKRIVSYTLGYTLSGGSSVRTKYSYEYGDDGNV